MKDFDKCFREEVEFGEEFHPEKIKRESSDNIIKVATGKQSQSVVTYKGPEARKESFASEWDTEKSKESKTRKFCT